MDSQPEKKYITADVLRKRKQDQSKVAQKVQQKIESIKKKKSKPAREVIPIDEMITDYRRKQQAFTAYKKRNMKTLRENEKGDENKILFVIRIRGVKDISDQQQKILRSLKLFTPMSGVFMKQNTKNLNKLKKIENYITFGIPSRKMISELIYKRCFGRVNGKRVAINTNKIVEETLGEKGIICLEDLIVELSGDGENFEEVIQFLWPFKLNTPQQGFDVKNVTKPFVSGGEWGDREVKINDLIFHMI